MTRPAWGRATRWARALALALALSVPVSGATQAATEGSITGRVLVSPVALDLAIQSSTARMGTWVAARVTVRNLGSTAIARVSVRLRAPTGIVIRPGSARSVRRLAAGASAALDWSLCGRQPGAYLVFAEASFDGVVVDSAARLLTVTPGQGSCASAQH